MEEYITKDGYECIKLGETNCHFYLYCPKMNAMICASKLQVKETSLYVCGIGLIDCDNLEDFKEIKKSIAYRIWYGILSRIGKGNYKEVKISREWRRFSNFKKFHDENYRDGFVIDKDLRSSRYEKIYSAETCSYIPQTLNSAIRERSCDRFSFKKDDKGNYFFLYTVYGSKPYNIYDRTLEGICEKYSIFRCTRVLSIYNEYRKELNPKVGKAIETFYDFKNYYERLYADCIGNIKTIMKQIDDGKLW